MRIEKLTVRLGREEDFKSRVYTVQNANGLCSKPVACIACLACLEYGCVFPLF